MMAAVGTSKVGEGTGYIRLAIQDGGTARKAWGRKRNPSDSPNYEVWRLAHLSMSGWHKTATHGTSIGIPMYCPPFQLVPSTSRSRGEGGLHPFKKGRALHGLMD